MKKVLILLIILTQAFFYHACNNNKDSKAKKSTVIANESDVDDDGKQFMKAAALGGIMEVELAKLAQKQASTPAVKEFAGMMISDHTRIYNDLKKLATDKYILLPITLEQEQTVQVDELKKLTGSTFDQNYMRMMVTSHEQALRDFEAGARNRDRQVNKFSSERLELLKKHLNTARSVFNNLELNRQ